MSTENMRQYFQPNGSPIMRQYFEADGSPVRVSIDPDTKKYETLWAEAQNKTWFGDTSEKPNP